MEKLLALSVPGYGSLQAPEGIPSGTQYSIGSIATGFLSVVTIIGILLSLIYLIYGGLYWLQASGDKTKWDKSRRIIVYSIAGLIVMSLSLLIVNLIAAALGVTVLIDASK